MVMVTFESTFCQNELIVAFHRGVNPGELNSRNPDNCFLTLLTVTHRAFRKIPESNNVRAACAVKRPGIVTRLVAIFVTSMFAPFLYPVFFT
eukprot:12696650-Ditylum_brightwellii.AAC.1